MKYFEIKNSKWVECSYNLNAKHIVLYDIIDGLMTPIGIGQY